VFVAENVKALLRHEGWLQQVLKDFNQLGYKIDYHLYQAADYGVPQTRERVMFLAHEIDVKPFVCRAPSGLLQTGITAKEAIGDLENLDQSPAINHIWSLAETSPSRATGS